MPVLSTAGSHATVKLDIVFDSKRNEPTDDGAPCEAPPQGHEPSDADTVVAGMAVVAGDVNAAAGIGSVGAVAVGASTEWTSDGPAARDQPPRYR